MLVLPAVQRYDRRVSLKANMYACMAMTYSKGKDQPSKVANPARGQLNRENNIFFPVSVRA